MSAKSENSIISSSCPSTFSSLHSISSTHLPVITTKNNNSNFQQYSTSFPFFSSISALNEYCPIDSYLQQRTSQTSQQCQSSIGYLYRNSWANLLTDIGENKENNKLKDNKINNKTKSEFSFRTGIFFSEIYFHLTPEMYFIFFPETLNLTKMYFNFFSSY